MPRLIPVLVLLAALAGCSSDSASEGSAASTSTGAPSSGSSSADAGRLSVVATTTVVADLVRNVAGSDVDVVQLLQPNVDPHDHEASPSDVQALADADLVVTSGVGLEAGWLDPALEASGFSGTTVDSSAGVEVRPGDGSEEESEGDPHIWHDPRNAKLMVQNIEKALSAADPSDAPAFSAAATAYSARLDALDAEVQAEVDTVPAADRQLVTDHDAFGYYAARYGFTIVGSIIPSFDTSAGLSGVDLAELVTKIQATGTKAVFSESSLPENAAKALADEAGVAVVAGEDSLYADTLGPAGSAGATYLEMLQHNTEVIVGALS